MAKIATYAIDATPTVLDKVIGTNVDDANITMNYTIGDIIALAPGGKSSVQSVNSLTGAIEIVGAGGITVDATGTTITLTGSGGSQAPAAPFNSIQVNTAGDFGSYNWLFVNPTEQSINLGLSTSVGGRINIFSGSESGRIVMYDIPSSGNSVSLTAPPTIETSYQFSLPSNGPTLVGDTLQILSMTEPYTTTWGNKGIVSVTGDAPVNTTVKDGIVNVTVAQSSSDKNGYLSSTDWNTFNGKQSGLVSGTNIKTINGVSILGSGDLVVSGGDGVTSVTASGTTSGLSLNSTGGRTPDIQLSGALTLTSTQITTGLGFTPYNATNPSNFINTVTTTGTSGPATVSGTTINIPQYSGGGSTSPGGGLRDVQYNNPLGTFEGNDAFRYVLLASDHSQLTLGKSDASNLGVTPGELVLHTQTVGAISIQGQIQFEHRDLGNYVTLSGAKDAKSAASYQIYLPALAPTKALQVMSAGTDGQLTWVDNGSGGGAVTSLTTTGTSGVSTLTSGVLNIPNYASGGGITFIGEASTNTSQVINNDSLTLVTLGPNTVWKNSDPTFGTVSLSASGGIDGCEVQFSGTGSAGTYWFVINANFESMDGFQPTMFAEVEGSPGTQKLVEMTTELLPINGNVVKKNYYKTFRYIKTGDDRQTVHLQVYFSKTDGGRGETVFTPSPASGFAQSPAASVQVWKN